MSDGHGTCIAATTFHKIVDNGFNPFTGNMRLSFELTLADFRFTCAQSIGILYNNWKLQALASQTDWLLCATCYNSTRPYSRKWWHIWKPSITSHTGDSHCQIGTCLSTQHIYRNWRENT